MKSTGFRLIGQGVYTLTEASRLTGVPLRRIKRWVQGYTYRRGGTFRRSDPIIRAGLDPIAGAPVLAFADLIEVRFLSAFRDNGISWHSIRIASERASRLLKRSHPFSSKAFLTDRHTILVRIAGQGKTTHLLDLVRNQYEVERFIGQYLVSGLSFDEHDSPVSWWPLGQGRTVVIDPLRSFGNPISDRRGVRTDVIFRAFQAEQSEQSVADWLELHPHEVSDAIAFEQRLRQPQFA